MFGRHAALMIEEEEWRKIEYCEIAKAEVASQSLLLPEPASYEIPNRKCAESSSVPNVEIVSLQRNGKAFTRARRTSSNDYDVKPSKK